MKRTKWKQKMKDRQVRMESERCGEEREGRKLTTSS